MARPSKLAIHPKKMVLAALRKSGQPLGAYDILERLKPQGVQGATVVYRALEALIKEGAVHKIQALNSFVACDCTAEHEHRLSVLTVCHDCKSVNELHDHEVIHQLESLSRKGVSIVRDAVIELPVTCQDCTA